MPDVRIREVGVNELGLLLSWREEVLRCVFSLPEKADTSALMQANEVYYKNAVPSGKHIACFAQIGGETIGCGGLCLHDEMPSPDNPTGRCAYLMNIYVRKEHRGEGAGKKIVRYLIGCALERNITKIYLETSSCGRPLYEAAGFSEMRDMMLLTYGK